MDDRIDLDLTQAILARTSGSPCRRLEALACDWVDGTLAPAQASLAQAHLRHCAACQGLIAALGRLANELPRFAQAEPGPGFTATVLEATRPEPPSFRVTWLRLMRRPRICWEAAYLGTVAGILTLHAPIPALRNLTQPAQLLRLTKPLEGVTPALQAGRTRLETCQARTAQRLNQQSHKAHTLWEEVRTAVTSWLSRIWKSLR